MSGPATILELRQRRAEGIYGVTYRRGRPRAPQRLLDGLIVERPTARQRCQVGDHPAPCLELAIGGGPATIHHIYLGLVSGYLPFDGVYLLPSGEIAAVYGADVAELGQASLTGGAAVIE